jgi:peptidoglycan/xylan/chitin deacetylase (PgdA/CDA1 family)
VIKQIVDGGHAIGVHSETHDYQQIYASEDAYLADFNAMKQIIHEQAGVDVKLFRFPGGSSNSVSKFNPGIMTRLTKLMTDMGYTYFDWNVSSGDAGANATSVEVIFNNVITGIQAQKVPLVLQHDINEFSVQAVESILIWGLQNGCTFQALTENSPTCHHPINN